MSYKYVFIDCDKVQSYVFASIRLREICKASLLLDWIESEVIPCVAKSYNGKVIRAGGGVVLVEFKDTNKAKDFLKEAQRLYWEHGILATFFSYSLSSVNDFYSDVLKPVFLKMKEQKEMQEGFALRYSTVHSVPCESSGLSPAERVVPVPDGLRRMGYAESRKRLSDLEETKIEREDLSKKFKLGIPRHFGGVVSWKKEEEPKEKDIPGTSEGRLLGIVYVDVNALGRLTPTIGRNKEIYNEFCKKLRTCLEKALSQSLQEVLENPVKAEKPREADALPVRVLYIGGDDLAVAIKGFYAVDFAAKFVELFEEKSKSFMKELNIKVEGAPDKLTISVGLVIAPYNYPIHNFNLVGKDLMKRSKRIGRREESLIDICMIKNNAVGGLKEIRVGKEKEIDGKFLLYGGPYTPEKLRKLEEATLYLEKNEFPKHKLHQLHELLYLPVNQNQLTFEYARWLGGLSKKNMQCFTDICNKLSLCVHPLPWKSWQGIYRTSVIDLIELYDLFTRR
ncbi:MAG: hypothetical protein J7K33_10650 [Candidatus Marinimicrobia bacterium]|nr:hypothetical protein [Candidatus Neomarinimicrobiota bacterium]